MKFVTQYVKRRGRVKYVTHVNRCETPKRNNRSRSTTCTSCTRFSLYSKMFNDLFYRCFLPHIRSIIHHLFVLFRLVQIFFLSSSLLFSQENLRIYFCTFYLYFTYQGHSGSWEDLGCLLLFAEVLEQGVSLPLGEPWGSSKRFG